MPIPRRVGQWNKVGLNRLTRHIAPWMPGFGVIVHRGRRSGRRYQTPVNVFPTADGWLYVECHNEAARAALAGVLGDDVVAGRDADAIGTALRARGASEWERVLLLRKTMAALPPIEAMEKLIENLEATKTNAELLLSGLK